MKSQRDFYFFFVRLESAARLKLYAFEIKWWKGSTRFYFGGSGNMSLVKQSSYRFS